ncbi:MAG: STAS domain-containing protein [Candidatus Korobacteraceae bacterium]
MATTPSSQRSLRIEQTISADGTPTLICKGRINLESADAFRTEVKSLSPTHATVLADLSGVDAVDSSGLGAILGTYVSAKNDGCNLFLINVNSRVKDLLNITKLASVIGVQ